MAISRTNNWIKNFLEQVYKTLDNIATWYQEIITQSASKNKQKYIFILT